MANNTLNVNKKNFIPFKNKGFFINPAIKEIAYLRYYLQNKNWNSRKLLQY